MVGIAVVGPFLTLKLRLLRNQLRRGAQQVLGLVVVLALATLAAGAVAAVIATGTASPALFGDLFVLFAALLCVGWALVPVAASGIDSTLDVSRLALLPLRGRTHGAGLLAASLIGVGPLATVLVLLGFAFQADGLAGRLGVLAAVAVQTVQVVLIGRIVVSSLGALLRRRRTRELAFTLGAFSTAGLAIGMQLLARGTTGLSARTLRRWADRARLNPFGLAGRAGARFIAGDRALRPGPSGWVWLAAAVAVLALSAGLWWRLVERELTTVGGDGGGGRRRPRPIRARRPVTAVAERELRYLWRHPVARTNTLTSLLAALLVFGPQHAQLQEPWRVLTAAALVGSVGLSGLNMLAVDAAAAATDLLCAPLAVIVTGKALARAALSLGLVGIGAVILATWSGGWGYVPATLAASLGLLGPILGVGAFASVAVPVPVPDVAAGNPWSSNPGRGCVTGIAALGLFLVAGVVASPVVVGLWVSQRSGSLALLATVSVLAPGYGWLTWRAGAALAARRTDGRVPELLAALAPT